MLAMQTEEPTATPDSCPVCKNDNILRLGVCLDSVTENLK